MASFFRRGIRKLIRPFVKLDNRLEAKISEKENKSQSKYIKEFDDKIERDEFFSSISVITHAGGGMQGLSYLNCEEAFPIYYERGNRVFEYDVDVDNDGNFILTHGDTEDQREEILDGRFNPLSIEKCCDLILEKSDIKVIFDCKFTSLKNFAKFIKDYIKEESALRRVVIQVFSEQNVIEIREVFDFKILHVCMMATDYLETVKTCMKHNIGAVSISTKALKERIGYEIFELNNVCVFAYTVNTVKEFKNIKENGMTGIFSDFLLESDVK